VRPPASCGSAVTRRVRCRWPGSASDPCFDAVDYLLDGAGRDGVDARCAELASASGLDAERLYAWCRAIAAIVAILYLRRPDHLGRPEAEQAVAELLALAR
jgi:streptomycin 6-kinase